MLRRLCRVIPLSDICYFPDTLDISEHPEDVNQCPVGHHAEFVVKATGPGQLVYLWERTDGRPLDEGERIEGKNSAHLKILRVKAEDEGSYKCTVNNEHEKCVSHPANLTIGKAPEHPEHCFVNKISACCNSYYCS